MASSGPNSPGTIADVNNSGTDRPWTNISNVGASDNSYATQGLSALGGSYGGGGESNDIKTTNYGFSIPSGATINGIVVEVEKKSSNASDPGAGDAMVRLVKAGSKVGSDKKAAGNWGTSDAYTTYGSSSDLWGTTWTDSEINSSGFGVSFAAIKTGGGKSLVTVSVDHIRITVYYTAGATFIASQQRPILQAVKRSNFY